MLLLYCTHALTMKRTEIFLCLSEILYVCYLIVEKYALHMHMMFLYKHDIATKI